MIITWRAERGLCCSGTGASDRRAPSVWPIGPVEQSERALQGCFRLRDEQRGHVRPCRRRASRARS